MPSKIGKTTKSLKEFKDKISKKAGGKIDFIDYEQRFLFAKEFDIPYTSFQKFLTAVQEIEYENSNLTKDEQKQFFKKKLKEVRVYIKEKMMFVSPYFLPELKKALWNSDAVNNKMQLFTTFYCYKKLEKYLIGRIDELENSNNMTKNSPWSSGLFYLLVAIVIIAGLGVLSKTVHWSLLPIIIIGGLLIIGLIGFLQLRNDEKLKDETFLELVIETYKRLPIIGNLFNKK